MTDDRSGAGWRGYALVAPALAVIGLFFVLPLLLSAVLAFRTKDGEFTLEHFAKSWDLYRTDLLFTVGIVLLSTLLIGLIAIAIAGYLTLGENPRAVAILRWLYRWPLFIPFIVTGQIMRTFLAKNGMLNHVLIGSGMIDPNSPTMITVDVAYRISTLSDYAVANALCLLSLIVAAGGAWFYLRHAGEGTRA